MSPDAAPSWDPEDILHSTEGKDRKIADLMVERYGIKDAYRFKVDYERLKTSYLAVGMGLGAGVGGFCMGLLDWDRVPGLEPSLDAACWSLIAWALICYGAGLYFHHLFRKGARA